MWTHRLIASPRKGRGVVYETEKSSCDSCMYYEYDEDYECYVCGVNLDEDEMGRFLRGTVNACPYYQSDDEYRIVRRQM